MAENRVVVDLAAMAEAFEAYQSQRKRIAQTVENLGAAIRELESGWDSVASETAYANAKRLCAQAEQWLTDMDKNTAFLKAKYDGYVRETGGSGIV